MNCCKFAGEVHQDPTSRRQVCESAWAEGHRGHNIHSGRHAVDCRRHCAGSDHQSARHPLPNDHWPSCGGPHEQGNISFSDLRPPPPPLPIHPSPHPTSTPSGLKGFWGSPERLDTRSPHCLMRSPLSGPCQHANRAWIPCYSLDDTSKCHSALGM